LGSPLLLSVPIGSGSLEVRKILAVLPNSGSFSQYGVPLSIAQLIDETVDGLTDKIALFLPHRLSHSGQFVALALC
jgi:hypothetical protein